MLRLRRAARPQQPQRDRIHDQGERGHHDDQATGHDRRLAQPLERLDDDHHTNPEQNDRIDGSSHDLQAIQTEALRSRLRGRAAIAIAPSERPIPTTSASM